jgi:hypothetical protein
MKRKHQRYLSKAYWAYRNRVHMHHYGVPYSLGYASLNALGCGLADSLYLANTRMGIARRMLATPEAKAAADAQYNELVVKQEKEAAERKAVWAAYKADLQPYNRKFDWTTRGIYKKEGESWTGRRQGSCYLRARLLSITVGILRRSIWAVLKDMVAVLMTVCRWKKFWITSKTPVVPNGTR